MPQFQRNKDTREDKPYLLPDFNVLGFNYRMTDLQGALGGVQLKLEEFIEQRKKWAQYYINELSSLDWLKLPIHSEKYKHGWQSFVMLVDEESKSPMSENQIMEKLQKQGIY